MTNKNRISNSVRRSLPLLTHILVVLLIFADSPALAAYPPSAHGDHVAVVTDHAEASRAALETLHHGGTAVDAAISAALTLGVVNPTASGLGGGGFALVYSAKSKTVTVADFRETAPKALTEAMLEAGGPRGATVGVPGEPAGLAWLHTRFGKLSLQTDAAPAIRLARGGFAVGRYLADQLPRLQKDASLSSEIGRAFFPSERPAPFRSRIVRKELADTIERFGREGATPFYRGDIAKGLVDVARLQGSPINEQDFADYEVKERAPFTRAFGDLSVVTMPAPSAGGLMLLEALSLVGSAPNSPSRALGFNSSTYLHLVSKVLRGAIADRMRVAGDPNFEPSVTAEYTRLLSDDALAKRRRELGSADTKGEDAAPREKGTSHLIVVDAEGNVVSLTTTINGPFGAKIVEPKSGILLNDEMSDFTLAKDFRGFGLSGESPNRVRGGARPVSSMTPTIVFKKDRPVLIAGGSGGMRIASGVTQATLCRLVFELDPTVCVSSPRIFASGTTHDLFVESEVAEDVRAGLRARGEIVKDEFMTTSAIHLVAWDGRWLAGADPRKAGMALGQ